MSERHRLAAQKSRRPRSRIEQSEHRPAIERELALGRSMSSVGMKYGFSTLAIMRFRDRMSPQLKAAIMASVLKPGTDDLEKLRVDESEGILTSLAGQRARLLVMQDEAMSADDFAVANAIAHTVHENIKLVGRYLGQFAQHHVSSNVNVLVSEDYLRVRQALTVALRPFPEARRAVAAELQRLEGQIAQRFIDRSRDRPPMLEHNGAGA